MDRADATRLIHPGVTRRAEPSCTALAVGTLPDQLVGAPTSLADRSASSIRAICSGWTGSPAARFRSEQRPCTASRSSALEIGLVLGAASALSVCDEVADEVRWPG